jgi:hypothetical protein
MFFDESSKVVEKSKWKAAKHPPPLSQHPSDQERVVVHQSTAPVRLTDVIFYQPLDDIALNFFMTNYVGNTRLNTQFDYMPDLYRRDGFSQHTIRETIKAVGMAGYAKAARRPEMMQTATRSYITAIQEVNNALSQPALALQESTLASILLLAMFEVMVMSRNQGFSNITGHLNGAISVAALHIKRHKNTGFGLKLMLSLYHSVILNCWVQNIPLPDSLLPIKNHLDEAVPRPNLEMELLDTLILLINFRHAIAGGSLPSPHAIIAEASALDERIRAFADHIPEDGRFTTVRGAVKNELAFDGYYHIYTKNFTAHFWNDIRSVRIGLHTLISRKCLHLLSLPERQITHDESITTQLDISRALICTMAKEICATVPQLAGYLDRLESLSAHSQGQDDNTSAAPDSQIPTKSSSSSKRASPPLDPPTRPALRPGSRYGLLFQLRKLLSTPGLTDDMQSWIENRIRWIESSTDPEDLRLLEKTRDGAPTGAFPFFVNT